MPAMELDAEFLQREVDQDMHQGKPDAGDVVAQYQSWGVTAVLKPYQAEGVAWLIRRHNEGLNVILGDEMGLGKTLQAITFVSYLKAQKYPNPVLVLCPLSVTQGWVSEFAKFSLNLGVIAYTGQKEHRESIRSTLTSDDAGLSFDVLISTYELVMVDAAFLSSIPWGYVIVDEAQRLKNSSSVLFKTLEDNFKISRRLLLTGTPIQNNISELWSLLHFCNPAIFDSLELFVNFFSPDRKSGTGDEPSDRLGMLRVLLSAYMLRRTKATLMRTKDLILPPLTEVTIFVQLSPLQRSVYVCVLKKDINKLVGVQSSSSHSALQNMVVQLRKACSHPYLFDGVEPEPFEEGEHLVQASSKLMVLDLILEKLYDQGHRVLVFAQMTRTLDILQDFLEFRHYSYERLDGSVRAEERFAAVNKFSQRYNEAVTDTALNHDGKPFVFMLTTRAGGVGLNLVAADTVIFFEQDWNPQADKQALQRVHRIGQTHPVLAINLVCQHTIEEIIRKRAQKKLQLTHDVIGSADADEYMEELKSSKLQSMIMFSLQKISADCAVDESCNNPHSAVETLTAVQKTVVDALNKRGQIVSDVDVTADKCNVTENADVDDNIHTFDGKSYALTGKDRQENEDREDDWASSADKAVIASWLYDSKYGESMGRHPAVSKRKRLSTPDTSAEHLEQARAEKQKKAEERKQRKWESMGYVSLALGNAGQVSDHVPGENDTYLHFVIGDCTRPAKDETHNYFIIMHFVDESGTWGRGGMFTVLSRLSQKVPEAYTAANDAGDLHLGDLHLVPVSDGQSTGGGSQSVDQEAQVSVALAVVQSYDRRRKVPRGAISMSAVETCLKKVCTSAASSCATVHVPRVGSRSSDGKSEWYIMERLLRKYANSFRVHVNVYYYNRNHHS